MSKQIDIEDTEDKRRVTIYVPISFHKKMKKLSAETGEPVSTLLEKAAKRVYNI